MNLTTQAIQLGTGATSVTAGAWLASLQADANKFQISVSAKRLAAFLANVGVESGRLTTFVENLDYSAQALATEWPARFATNPTSKPLQPNALALEIQRNPQAIANHVYANRLGNGDVASGDGWKYRGTGPIQLTGKANIAAAAAGTGLDLLNHPELAQQPSGGSLTAAWFFSNRGCNDLADADRLSDVIKAINGSGPCAANEGPLRISNYMHALSVLK